MSELAIGIKDKQGVMEAVTYLGQLVEEEVKAGIPAERIVVGGFSQVRAHWALGRKLEAAAALA